MVRLKNLLCLLLCAVLVFSNVPIVNAAEAQAEQAYDIYPVVRQIAYDDTQFRLDAQVHVVYETGIDDATKAYLSEVLAENSITATVAAAPVDGAWNILLGVNGSGEAADAYADTLTLTTANLYTNADSYLLEAKEKQITIVGCDTDAVYCGVATLKMMLSSFENNILIGAQIEDWAGMEYRGFIEGFYGGWNYETRAQLMEFARDVKMNMYVYASKTDAYHTSRWAELYPAADIAQIEELVKIGQQTKCRYVWSVHLGSFFSGLDITTNSDLYETRYAQLVAKLTQLYDVGVRKFDILNDDFGSGSHADVVTVLNRLNQEFIIPMGCEPITYCPQGYNKSWSGTGAELDTLANLDDSIILYWTDDDVNSPITQSTVDYVAGKTGQPVCFWLNYPVNEHAKSGIFLGSIDHYARDGVTGLKAAVSNPSRFGQSNKVALFQLACLFWNNADYSAHSEEIWHDAFNYLEEGVEDVYRTIARNVANCPGSSRVGAGFPESEYIKENLAAVSNAIANGEPIADLADTQTLLTEFANILSAVTVFRANCANADLVSELEPWLKSLEGVTAAAQAAINSVVALENGSSADAWTHFAAAGKALQHWDAYLTCDDTSVTNKALAGSKRLHPFASDMIAHVESTLTPLFDPDYTSQNLYAVLGGQKQSMDDNAQKIFDGDLATYAQWNVVQQQDDYFGVDLGVVKTVTDITIVQANSDTHHDYFHKAVLEYSEDGKTFTQLGSQYNDTYRIELDGLDIQARYVRLRLVETGTASKPDYWTHVREFTVNKVKPDGNRVYTNAASCAHQPLTINGKEYSLSGLNGVTLAAGEYIGIKFQNLSLVSAIVKEGTGLDGLTFEYSTNGSQWTTADTLTGSAVVKYVRLYNGTGAAVSFDLAKLGVTVESAKADPKFLETNLTNGLKEGAWANVFDGQESTYAWTNEGQSTGDYITLDLGADKTSIFDEMTMRYFNKIYPTLMYIQISNDAATWYDISQLTRDHNGQTHPVVTESYDTPYAARYVRLFFEELNSAAAGNGVGLTEWSITGVALSGVSLKSVSPVDEIHKEWNEELTVDELPGFVSVTLTQADTGDLQVMVPVCWDLSAYDAAQSGNQTIEGTLILPASVEAADSTVAVTVTVAPLPGAAYNAATDTAYDTVAAALKAAQTGETVILLTDCTEKNLLVTPGITLDLNGKALTASYIVGFNNAHIVDNAGGGRLVTGQQNLVLDEENAMVPVYDGSGYIFTKAGFGIEQDASHQDDGIKIKAAAYPTNMEVVELLKDGTADNNLQIMILLTWDTDEGTGSQRFVFTDEVVASVYSSNQGQWNKYEKMFSMVITGFETVRNVTANIMLVSGTNVQYVSTNDAVIQ